MKMSFLKPKKARNRSYQAIVRGGNHNQSQDPKPQGRGMRLITCTALSVVYGSKLLTWISEDGHIPCSGGLLASALETPDNKLKSLGRQPKISNPKVALKFYSATS